MSIESKHSLNGSQSPARFSVGEIGVMDIWEIVRRHKLLVAGALVVGWGLSAAYFLVAPSKYENTGDKVTFTGFGTFRVSSRAAREGINPQTKERIQIPAMKVPKFTAGKSLKEAVK